MATLGEFMDSVARKCDEAEARRTPTDTTRQGVLPTLADTAVKGAGFCFGVAAAVVVLSLGG